MIFSSLSSKSFISILCIKIQESLDQFESQYPQVNLSNILVTGGGSFLPGINLYLSKVFNVETDLIDPFKSIEMKNKDFFSEREKFVFAPAVGLLL